jgi:protoporphyrinogen/coproporphyrinogen III oxidase
VSLARVVIVGGGISGLASAYYLGQFGIDSVLVEKSGRLGGLIKTDSVAGCRLEAGPDSYISAKPAVTKLAGELGSLGQQVISSNDESRRIFIVRGGRLIPLPSGMTMMVPGKWLPALRSELFSFDTKLRFLSERFRRPLTRHDDISVGELVSDHFGSEVLEYVADPLLVGVYGGDTASLSAESVLPRFVTYEQRYGSLIRGVHHEKGATPKTGLFLSFRDGMQTLTDDLAAAISGSTRIVYAEATAVRRGKEWEVEVHGERLPAEHLILACPALLCSRLLEDAVPELAQNLAAIPYSSAILVTLLYDSRSIQHPLDGFGFLVPKSDRRTTAAATWINTKFPSRIAEGQVAIRAFIVADDALRLQKATDVELADLVIDDLRRFMGIDASPKYSAVQRWPASMPQYIVGHKTRLERIRESLLENPNLYLVGNAYDGVGIPDCVRLAETTAKQVAQIKTL